MERRKAQGLRGNLCGFSRYQTRLELSLSPQTTFRENSRALTCLPFWPALPPAFHRRMQTCQGEKGGARGFPGGSDGGESACNVGDQGSIPGWGRSPWRREWQPIPVFLPGEFHEERSVAGYSPWGCKESDTTERLTHTHTQTQWEPGRPTASCHFPPRMKRYSLIQLTFLSP